MSKMAKNPPPNLFKRLIAFALSFAIALPLFVSEGVSKKSSVYAAEENVAYGDINSDGSINFLDMILLKSYLLENNTSHFSVKAADVDDDGTVSSKDVVELSMYLLEQIGSFSYEKNIDTDKDGLCDYIEKEVLRTDPLNPDSDYDGLSDYAEIYYCGTDPNSKDTGNTDIPDGKKDADSDGICNLDEIEKGTSPALSDTDGDGLSDYDELYVYHTSPLKEDSDGDKISDFGEIKLGLNPNEIRSDGIVIDSDRIFEQKSDEKSELISFVDQQNYSLSIYTKSSGYLEENANVSVSKYTNFLNSDVIFGDIIDIEYDNYYLLEEITLNFCLNDGLNPENYAIFKFSEELNMIFPTETSYDGNNLSVNDDCDGTYCLVDINKWIKSLGVSENIQPDPTPAPHVIGSVGSSRNMDLEVYFLLYLKKDYYQTGCQSIINASKSIIEFCNSINQDVKIYYFSYMGNPVVSLETNKNYISNSTSDDEIESVVKRSQFVAISADSSSYPIPMTIRKNLLDISLQSSFTEKYLFIVDGDTEPYSGNVENEKRIMDQIKSNGIFVSFICNAENKNVEMYEQLSSDNKYYELTDDFSKVIEERIFNDESQGLSATYNIETGFCNEIEYNIDIIDETWKDAFIDYMSGKYTVDDIKKMDFPDTDCDGTPDCLEINFGYISFDEYGSIILPTYGNLARVYGKGYGAFLSKMSSLGYDIDYIKVLPLFSYPTIDDSDCDGLSDLIDSEPTKAAQINIDDSLLNDKKIFIYDYKPSNNMVVEGNGIVHEHSQEKKNNVIEYTRYKKNGGTYTSNFYIVPDNDSDYLISAVVGKNDNIKIEVYYEKIIGKSIVSEIKLEEGTDTVSSEETIGKNIRYNKAYSLKSGKKYHIFIKIESEISDYYTLSIEQDNWIHAPYGGYILYPFNQFLLHGYEKTVFLSSDMVYNILEEADDRLGVGLKNISNNNSKDDALFSSRVKAETFLYLTNYSDRNEIISEIVSDAGNAVSISGVVLLIPKVAATLGKLSSPVGAVLTVIGGGTAVYSLFNGQTKVQDLQNAFLEGNYSIRIDEYMSYSSSTDEYDNYSYTYIESVNGWTQNKYYIRKYGEIIPSTRYSELMVFENLMTLEYDNEGWKILDE